MKGKKITSNNQKLEQELDQLKEKLNSTQAELDRLNEIISLMPGHIYWQDRNNIFLGCNNQQAKNANLSNQEEIIGKSNYDMPWKKQAAALNELNNKVMETDQPHSAEEPALMADGFGIYLSQKVPLHDKNGKVNGVLGISLNITDRKKMEEELKATKEALAAANEAKLELLTITDHELRTPINDVLGASQLLQRQTIDPDEQTKLVDIVHNSGCQMISTIDYLLKYLEIEAGDLRVRENAMDLYETIKKLIRDNSRLAHRKGINDILLDYQPNYHFIHSDYRLLTRILETFLYNAVRFTDNDNIQLTVKEIHRADDEVTLRIEVSDHGPGIPLSKQKQLFNLFHQKLSSDDDNKPYIDAGLRLSISRELIHMLGGSIGVESQSGEGCIFWIEFTTKKIASAHTAASSDWLSAEAATQTIHKAPSVLLIEDDRINLYIEKRLLEELHCQVDTAINLKEALEKLDNTYDIIFSDISLPDGRGTDILPILREKKGDAAPPVIAVTSYASDDDLENFIEAGMFDVLTKPASLESFGAVIEMALAPRSPESNDLIE